MLPPGRLKVADLTACAHHRYCDEQLRISRDQDGKLFVYSKVSDSTAPTSYDEADFPADLGVSDLLQGMAKGLLGQ